MNETRRLPFVSIIIPSRNEERFIAGCLDSILAGSYPKDRLEILVADGMSSDGTRRIAKSYARKFPFIRMLDNPRKITASALNIGVRNAKGDIIIWMGAHARYETEYISKCVKYSKLYSADNVGGIRRTEPRNNTIIGKAIAYSVSLPFTAGGAIYRTGAKAPRWVDTVFGGCYRRDVFSRIGLVDERLRRGEDREFNQRLRNFNGRILFVPDIECIYLARGEFLSYCKWIFECGLWPFYASRICGRRVFSFRNFVPAFFVAGLMGCLVAPRIASVGWYSFLAVAGTYGLASLISAVPIARREQDLRFFVVMPFISFVTHFLYGIGSVYGLVKPVGDKTQGSGPHSEIR